MVLVRPMAERGVMVMIASGMPSPFWSTGSAVMTASGKATPLMTIVVGSMSVTGLKSGSTSALLKTKICSVGRGRGIDGERPEGLADADLGRDRGVDRDLERDERPFEDEDAAIQRPGLVQREARRPDDEVGDQVGVGRQRLTELGRGGPRPTPRRTTASSTRAR